MNKGYAYANDLTLMSANVPDPQRIIDTDCGH